MANAARGGMTADLAAAIDRAAQALLSEGAREVYVFGSATSGRFGEGSDVDLAVTGLAPERFLHAMGRAGDLLDRPLHLVDLDEDNPFTRYLRTEGVLERVG
ncbi:MAG: nucleotidyltransferase domain-containing protein [Armatimonadetes bacterium]|nr:nucleotidyltransferase domain-containing protein [Armatimonadota bacterium]